MAERYIESFFLAQLMVLSNRDQDREEGRPFYNLCMCLVLCMCVCVRVVALINNAAAREAERERER